MIRRYSELFVSAWFRGCLTARDTRSEYTKHPHDIHVYCTIRRNWYLCGCFVRSNTLDCTSPGEYNHPRVSNDHAQSTTILGSGEKVEFLRRFCMRFQFFQIIPETVRRQGSKTAQTILVVRSALYSIAPLALAGQQGFSLRFQAIFANVPAYLKLDPPCRNECRIWDTDFIYKNLSFEQYFSIVPL